MKKHLLFEDNSDFKSGTLISESGNSLQVTLASGKHVKVKTSKVLLWFDSPSPQDIMVEAKRLAETIDLGFLWSCAPPEEFDFVDFASEYFGHTPSSVESASLLFRIHTSPVYFHRKARGRYAPVSEQQLEQALAAIEKRSAQEAYIHFLVKEFSEGRVPQEIYSTLGRFLANPDKNSLEWKAFERVRNELRCSVEQLLLDLKIFKSPQEVHRMKFMYMFFPQGETLHACDEELACWDPSTLPLSDVQAFSIDDSVTTEIDDCFSVQTQADGCSRVGIHIAAPGLALGVDNPLDWVVRDRASTIYMPGEKITMMPGAWISAFSLNAGYCVPCVSLYLNLDATGTEIVSRCSRVERIVVVENLRYDQIDSAITEESLSGTIENSAPGITESTDEAIPKVLVSNAHLKALQVLWRLTLSLSLQRDHVRGKPEQRFRDDFNFYVDKNEDGQERVRILKRRRDAPLDRIVAEMMILANVEWGALLAEKNVSALYRSQQAGRVAMTTHPLPHQGLGVPQYLWSTSPLRRYPDLVNQRQLLSVLLDKTPPFSTNDQRLFSILSVFEEKYPAYLDFQRLMERFWCLRWIQQTLSERASISSENKNRFEAVVIKDGLLRLSDAPFYFRTPDIPALEPGQLISVDISECDLLGLSVKTRFVSANAQVGPECP